MNRKRFFASPPAFRAEEKVDFLASGICNAHQHHGRNLPSVGGEEIHQPGKMQIVRSGVGEVEHRHERMGHAVFIAARRIDPDLLLPLQDLRLQDVSLAKREVGGFGRRAIGGGRQRLASGCKYEQQKRSRAKERNWIHGISWDGERGTRLA
jgi:hypothetical protein